MDNAGVELGESMGARAGDGEGSHVAGSSSSILSEYVRIGGTSTAVPAHVGTYRYPDFTMA